MSLFLHAFVETLHGNSSKGTFFSIYYDEK